jgi:hypothetical protein
MAKYQVVIIGRPDNWQPEGADDVPLELKGPVGMLAESDDLFEAVSRAMEHNESDGAQCSGRWAVVVEPSSAGRIWPAARLCTPITYKVTSIWWPDGWEPQSPFDVPNCVWQAQGQSGGQLLSYPQAEATMLSLNRQSMDHPGTTWHVVLAVENEPVSRTISYNSVGTETTVEVRRMHVICPEGGGRGNCSHCPAHEFSCAKSDWTNPEQTISARHSRAFGVNAE